MRKKEVRWVSRDSTQDTKYACWRKHPEKGVDGIWRHDDGAVSVRRIGEYLGIELEPGGLAKITIERQY